MNKYIIKLLTAVALLGAASVIKSSAGCYYTAAQVCVPAGTVLSSTAVPCTCGPECNATLYDQVTTTGDAYTLVAPSVDGNHTSGNTAVVNGTATTTVGVQTTTVDPNTCNVTINPNAGTATISCPAQAADPNSAACYLVMQNSSVRSFYCLAAL